MIIKEQLTRDPVLETPTAKYWLIENIIYGIINKNAEQTLNDAMYNTRMVKETLKGKISPVLIDIRLMKSISAEAREYYSGEDVAHVHNACAIVIGNPISRIIGNFFIGLNKPGMPTRLFTTEKKAFQWLRRFTS